MGKRIVGSEIGFSKKILLSVAIPVCMVTLRKFAQWD
jgi:hypothetical protein